MTRDKAVQLVADLLAIDVSVSVHKTDTDWIVHAIKDDGASPAQITNLAGKYGVTGIATGVRFV